MTDPRNESVSSVCPDGDGLRPERSSTAFFHPSTPLDSERTLGSFRPTDELARYGNSASSRHPDQPGAHGR